MGIGSLTEEQDFELKKMLWQGLRAETLQEMRALDFWIAFILVVLIGFILISRLPKYADVIIWAAILGSVGMIWIGRKDVLIHRPAGPTRQVEDSFGQRVVNDQQMPVLTEPAFRGWENWYKARLSYGVKVLVPLDALAGIFLFALFLHADNAAWKYMGNSWYAGYFYWGCMVVHFIGWGIIIAAKPLAE